MCSLRCWGHKWLENLVLWMQVVHDPNWETRNISWLHVFWSVEAAPVAGIYKHLFLYNCSDWVQKKLMDGWSRHGKRRFCVFFLWSLYIYTHYAVWDHTMNCEKTASLVNGHKNYSMILKCFLVITGCVSPMLNEARPFVSWRHDFVNTAKQSLLEESHKLINLHYTTTFHRYDLHLTCGYRLMSQNRMNSDVLMA